MMQTQEDFLKIMSKALHGEQIASEPPGDELQEILAIAVKQHLLPVILEAFPGACVPDSERSVLAIYKQLAIGQVTQQAGHTLDFLALYRYLRKEGLHPVVVKGEICSRLYPQQYHRISVDNDLYLEKTELRACHRALVAYGLQTDTPEEQLHLKDEITYQDKNQDGNNRFYIEVHNALFDTDPDAPGNLNACFTDILQNAVEIDGMLAMSPQDHLLYLILHAFKHFIYSGVGIRQTCDITLWAHAYSEQIDWQRLFESCKCVHAEIFAAAQWRIAECLGFPMPPDECWQNITIDIDPMLEDMFAGGVFGADSLTRLHTSTVTLNAIQKSRRGKKTGIMRSIFPARTYMAGRYPYVQKCSFLLPVAWISRMIGYIGEVKHNESSRVSDSLRLAKERIRLLKYYGVIE